MRTALWSILALTALSAAVSPARAAPRPPPCSAPENRQLDFWTGDWDMDIDDGERQTGVNHVTRDEFGGCVIAEHFEASHGFHGASFSIYDAPTGKWRQTWVDNQGQVFVLVGGPVRGQAYVFELHTVDASGPGKTPMRMLWENVTADALTYRWQAQKPDGDWRDTIVIRYRRRPAGR